MIGFIAGVVVTGSLAGVLLVAQADVIRKQRAELKRLRAKDTANDNDWHDDARTPARGEQRIEAGLVAMFDQDAEVDA